MVLAGHEDTAVLTLTAVADFAAVVARAVDCEGRWPVDGGICGNRLTFADILGIGERVRGKKRASPSPLPSPFIFAPTRT